MATKVPFDFTSDYIEDLVLDAVTPQNGVATVTVQPSDATNSAVSFDVVDGITAITFNNNPAATTEDLKNLQPNKDKVFASIESGKCTNFQFPSPPPPPSLGVTGQFINHRFLETVNLYYPDDNVLVIRIASPDNPPKTCSFAVKQNAKIIINGQPGKKPRDLLPLKGSLVSVQFLYGDCQVLKVQSA
jgi:hypothetical protein